MLQLLLSSCRHCLTASLANMQVGERAADPVTPKLQFGPEDGVLETNVALSSKYLAVSRCMITHSAFTHQRAQASGRAACTVGCLPLVPCNCGTNLNSSHTSDDRYLCSH